MFTFSFGKPKPKSTPAIDIPVEISAEEKQLLMDLEKNKKDFEAIVNTVNQLYQDLVSLQQKKLAEKVATGKVEESRWKAFLQSFKSQAGDKVSVETIERIDRSFNILSKERTRVIADQVKFKDQSARFIQMEGELKEARRQHLAVLKEFNDKALPLLDIICFVLNYDEKAHTLDRVALSDMHALTNQHLMQIRENSLLNEDEALIKLISALETVYERIASLLNKHKPTIRDIIEKDFNDDVMMTTEKITAYHNACQAELAREITELKVIESQMAGRMIELTAREKATHELMLAMQANARRLLFAYGDMLLDGIDRDFDATFDPAVNQILRELAVKLRDDKTWLRSYEANPLGANRALRDALRLNLANDVEIKKAQELHINFYEELYLRLNRLHSAQIDDLRATLADNLNDHHVESKSPFAHYVAQFPRMLDRMSLESSTTLPTDRHWTDVISAQTEVERIKLYDHIFNLFDAIEKWQAKLLKVSYDTSHSEKYDKLKHRVAKIKVAITSPDWTKLSNAERRQLLIEATDALAVLNNKYLAKHRNDSALIAERRRERKEFCQPVNAFCESLDKLLALVMIDPQSVEKQARIDLITALKTRFETHRANFLQKVLGGRSDEQGQRTTFCRISDDILCEAFITNKALEKITDVTIQSKFKTLLRDLLKDVYAMIVKARGVKFSPGLFAKPNEAALAESAQTFANQIFMYSELGRNKRWTDTTPLWTASV